MLVDDARVSISNLNRLLGAGPADVGASKLLVRNASAHALLYGDLASDAAAASSAAEWSSQTTGERCLACLGELDQQAFARGQMSDEQRAAADKIYGIEREVLDAVGRSVVSANGVIASLAVTSSWP